MSVFVCIIEQVHDQLNVIFLETHCKDLFCYLLFLLYLVSKVLLLLLLQLI